MVFCYRSINVIGVIRPLYNARLVVFDLGRPVVKKKSGSAKLAMNVVCLVWSAEPGIEDDVLSTALSTTILEYRRR